MSWHEFYDAKHQEWIEEAKNEARQNLKGEDLEKCLVALDNWGKNYCYDKMNRLKKRGENE